MSFPMAFFLGVLVTFILSRIPRTPSDDWVARRHRQISRNGFKSRMGVR